MGLDQDGRIVVLCVAHDPWPDRFRTALRALCAGAADGAPLDAADCHATRFAQVYGRYLDVVHEELGGFLYKKRVARPGGGKNGGYRTVLSARIGGRCVFQHGFAKNQKANITSDEKKALQYAGKVFLDLSAAELAKAVQAGILWEVHCAQQTH